ncbi:hypothetical protein C7S16_0172 [Burkholderia thailandensis]|uniref:Uncharacterized protein n=1 Tax=Burkholderia thailandensis TaxID=57975 RepID=A0AAW9D0D1_BURTH|nr:hypothetical protein [Burkholderia thailandensis]MDW9255621.1 hypothetical protein [Burkholderia thailandensis]
MGGRPGARAGGERQDQQRTKKESHENLGFQQLEIAGDSTKVRASRQQKGRKNLLNRVFGADSPDFG